MSYQKILIAILVAGIPLFAVESFSRYKNVHGEFSRKLVHMISSLAVISLLLFCNLLEISIVAVVFVVFMLVFRRSKIFKSLYDVERFSWGEVMFPVGVFLAAVFAESEVAFVVAVLIMGLSDTIAYIVGKRWGKKTLPHSPKTYLGSAAFLTSALAILLLAGYPLLVGLAVSFIATLSELAVSNGIDNATIPLTVVFVLAIF